MHSTHHCRALRLARPSSRELHERVVSILRRTVGCGWTGEEAIEDECEGECEEHGLVLPPSRTSENLRWSPSRRRYSTFLSTTLKVPLEPHTKVPLVEALAGNAEEALAQPKREEGDGRGGELTCPTTRR